MILLHNSAKKLIVSHFLICSLSMCIKKGIENVYYSLFTKYFFIIFCISAIRCFSKSNTIWNKFKTTKLYNWAEKFWEYLYIFSQLIRKIKLRLKSCMYFRSIQNLRLSNEKYTKTFELKLSDIFSDITWIDNFSFWCLT